MSTEQENGMEAEKEAEEVDNTEAGSGTEADKTETTEPDSADKDAEVDKGEDNVDEEIKTDTVTDNVEEADKDTGGDTVDSVAEVDKVTSEQVDSVPEESGADESGDVEGKVIESNKEAEEVEEVPENEESNLLGEAEVTDKLVEEDAEDAMEGETEQKVDDQDQEMETEHAEGDAEDQETETGDAEGQEMETGDAEGQEMETGDAEGQEMETGDAEGQEMETGDAEGQEMETGDAEEMQAEDEEEEEEETEEDKAAGHLCKVCDIRFETYNEFFSHSRGMIHAQKVISTKDENWEDELKDKEYDQWANVRFGCFPDQVKKKSEPKRRPFYCSICKVQLSSERQFNDHVDGKKHIKLAEEMANLSRKTEDESGEVMRFMSSTEMKDAAYYCRLCFVQCSGEVPYRDHVTGKSHLKKKAEAAKEGEDAVLVEGTVMPPEGLVRCDATNAVIQRKLDKSAEPIAGEEHVIEILSADWAELRYYCYMCEIYINQATIYHHIIGMKHRLNFIKQKDHAKHQEISGMKRRSDKSAAITEYLKNTDSPIPRKVKVYHDPEDTTALMNITGGEESTDRTNNVSPARKWKAESPIRRNERRRRSRSRDRSAARRDRRDRNRSRSRGRERLGGRGDRRRRSQSNSLDRLSARRDRRRRSRSDSLERWSDRRERDRRRRSRSGSFDKSYWGRDRHGRSHSHTRGDSPFRRADSDRYGRREDPYAYAQDRGRAPYSYPGLQAPPPGYGGGYSGYNSSVVTYPDYGSRGADPYYRSPAEGARPNVGARANPYSVPPPAPVAPPAPAPPPPSVPPMSVPPPSVPGHPAPQPATNATSKAPSELELLFKSMVDTVQRDSSAATVALSLSTALTEALIKRQGTQLTAQDLTSPEIQKLLAAAGSASKPAPSPSDAVLDQIRKSMALAAKQPKPSAPRTAVAEATGYRAPPSRSGLVAGSHSTSAGYGSYPVSKQGALGGGYGTSTLQRRPGGNDYGSSSQQQRAGGSFGTSSVGGYRGSGFGGGSSATSGYVGYPSYSASSKQRLAEDRGVAQGFRTDGYRSTPQQQRPPGSLGTIADNYDPPPRQQQASDRSETALSWDNLPPEIRLRITETVQQNMGNKPY